MGWYTAQNNDKVNRLVLYAPQWVRNVPALTDTGGKLGAYRSVSREAAKGRWLTGVAEDKNTELIPAGWFEAWADATFATDAAGANQTLPVLRAPNGVVRDGRESGVRASRCTTRPEYAYRPSSRTPSGMPTCKEICCTPASPS